MASPAENMFRFLGGLGGGDNALTRGADAMSDPLRREELLRRREERTRSLEQRQGIQEMLQNPEILGQLSQRFGVPPELLQQAGSLQELGQLGRLSQGGISPSAVREYEFFKQLPPEEQQQYQRLKRAQQVRDIGGSLVNIDPRTGQAVPLVEKTLTPAQRPETQFRQEEQKALGKLTGERGLKAEVAAEVAEAGVTGKGRGEAKEKLSSMTANMPKVEKFVKELRELSDTATYTKGGQLVDTIRRQTGQEPRESSVAREKFISKINNEVLPLLKETFGAAFTVQEGESLKATLGNPDLAPSEKQAVLDAFIEGKAGEIESLQRRVGGATNKVRRYNPATGRIE